LGFECLITDFVAPAAQTALASSTTMPPTQKLDYTTAKITWDNFCQGNMDLRDLFTHHGSKVCMVAAERSQVINRMISLLQRHLMVMHLKTDKDIHTKSPCPHHLSLTQLGLPTVFCPV